MGALQLEQWNYTYEDYKIWEGRWELINGQPFDMSPMPRPEHQRIGCNIIFEFKRAIKKTKCKHCKVYGPIDYLLSEKTILNPDVLIVYKAITKQYLDFSPSLVVEILSPSTAIKDKVTKFQLYASQSIPYYLIVDIVKKEIQIYHWLEDQYVLESIDENNQFIFTLEEGCNIVTDWGEVWE